MRFTVTALGSTGDRSVAAVVDDIAEYLSGPAGPSRDVSGGEAGDGPGRYYADRGESPGRWRGRGSTELGLAGDVDGEEFRSVLAARHPHTGERLISARGSAGRVEGLGTGSATRWSATGEALYSPRDAATVLSWGLDDVEASLSAGERSAIERLFAALCNRHWPGSSAAAMELVPDIDEAGSRWVPESELARVEALVAQSHDAQGVLAGGAWDDELSLADAAQLVGASPSYMARLCRAYAKDPARFETLDDDPGRSRRAPAFLVAQRGRGGEWRVSRRELAAFVERRRRPAVRVGYDITATTEKSFSVLGLLGGPEVRRQVLASIEAANDVGIDWLEAHAAAARAGNEVIGVTGWAAASFQHLTSRRLDPFVHHHNVVANSVVDEAGARRALDARRLYRSVGAASALATAQARWELASRLGVAFRPGRRDGWEVAGIDDAVLDEFSQRSKEISEAVGELEAAMGRKATLAEMRNAVATSRPPKAAGVDEAAVIEQWWRRAEALGLTPEALAGVVGQAHPTALTAQARRQVLADAAAAVTAQRSVFTRSDVLAALVDLPSPTGEGPLIVPAAQLERLADELLASPTVVALAASSGRHDVLQRQDGGTVKVGGPREPEYSTTEVLALQARTLETWRSRLGDGIGTVPSPILEAALARFPELSDEQQGLVRAFTTSGDGAQAAVGLPGTGKTHAMRAAVAAWQDAGYRVLGTAVKAEAARHLGDECAITTQPLAWYLARIDDPLRSPLDARTVLIVDEASTIADRDLHTLLGAAAAAGATIRMIGDPAQHSAVGAGGLWRVITERHAATTPTLTAGRRVRHAADRRAATALRSGDAKEALDALAAGGHLQVTTDERDLYVAMLARWWDARRRGARHPMVDRRNDRRLVLNRLARSLRQHHGELGAAEVTAAAGRRFAAGDEVTARMGARHLHPPGEADNWLRNGARGTVIDVVATQGHPERDHLRIDFHGLGAIDVPRSFFDDHTDDWGHRDVGIDHAYAVTSYAVQGLTFDESTSHLDPHSSRPEAYVDITRGRHANHVIISGRPDPLPGERLPAVPGPETREQLEHRLNGDTAEPAALDLDPTAGPAALHAAGKTLAQLTRERLAATETSERNLIRAAERIHESRIRASAAARTDAQLLARLVPRPPEAYLAAAHDQLLADLAIYRARWQPRPSRARWGWALGDPIDHPEADGAHQVLVERLEAHSVTVATRRRPEGSGGLTAGARQALCHLAATGELASLHPDRLDEALDTYDPADCPEAIADYIRARTAPPSRDAAGVS